MKVTHRVTLYKQNMYAQRDKTIYKKADIMLRSIFIILLTLSLNLQAQTKEQKDEFVFEYVKLT